MPWRVSTFLFLRSVESHLEGTAYLGSATSIEPAQFHARKRTRSKSAGGIPKITDRAAAPSEAALRSTPRSIAAAVDRQR
jgi:hypothetical protein